MKRKKAMTKLRQLKPDPLERQFAEVAAMIRKARNTAFQIVNKTLVQLHWDVGKYISIKVANAEWGEGTVEKLADHLERTLFDIKGFNRRGLYRMKQFYELYSGDVKVSPLVTQISWTNNLIIMSAANSPEEREFYLRLCKREQYSKRELERQIESRLFDRAMRPKARLSALLKETFPKAEKVFRDTYSLDFLGLPDDHSEFDLRKAIIRYIKQFILEFGRDFAFVGEEYRVQVGKDDYHIDLLFYQRELRCLVAFDLKIEKFKPEHIGKLQFYLESLDRDVKKPHENPSVGVVLCKEKDDEVVEYALSRTLAPAVVAEYRTKLLDKRLLQEKLHEFFDSSVREIRAPYGEPVSSPVQSAMN